jgi:hypothetical protein
VRTRSAVLWALGVFLFVCWRVSLIWFKAPLWDCISLIDVNGQVDSLDFGRLFKKVKITFWTFGTQAGQPS